MNFIFRYGYSDDQRWDQKYNDFRQTSNLVVFGTVNGKDKNSRLKEKQRSIKRL